jgi:AcrR family transcriptional regulator
MMVIMPKVVPEYKEEAKSKIVEAARIVFAKKGYHDSTMDDVAKEVGVSKGALYSYFKSKEDILKETYLQTHQTLRTIINTASEKPDLAQAFEEVYSMVTERYKGNLHRHFEQVALASHDPLIKKIIMDDYQRDVKTVQAFVEEKMKQGLMRTDVDAQTIAELFTALFMGTMEKLVLGFPNKDVHDQWIKSMILILGKTTKTN